MISTFGRWIGEKHPVDNDENNNCVSHNHGHLYTDLSNAAVLRCNFRTYL